MARRLEYDATHDYYALLGVPPDADLRYIQRAYRQRAKDLHPDRHADAAWATEAFQRLNEAYAVLSDPVRRHQYDDLRWLHARQDGPAFGPRQSSSAPNGPTADDPWRDFRRDASSIPGWDYAAWSRENRPPPPPEYAAFYPQEPTARAGPLRALLRVLLGGVRGPYAAMYLFLVVSCALAGVTTLMLNNLVVETLPQVLGEVSGPLLPATVQPTQMIRLTAVPTPSPLPLACSAGVQITSPGVDGTLITGPFSILGTASADDFDLYEVEVALLASAAQGASNARIIGAWNPLGSPARRPVEDGVLVEVLELSQLEPGPYLLRLKVRLQSGVWLPACARLVIFDVRQAGQAE